MTCIVGMKCPETGDVYIGGDSAGVAGFSVTIRADQKVFRNGPFLMGFTSSFRMGQLLRYDLAPPDHPNGLDDMAFMVTKFIPAVRDVFRNGGFQETTNGAESGGSFLVGYRQSLFRIESDYQVGQSVDDLMAVGCGADVALGAMFAGKGRPPKERIKDALKITAHLNAGVRAPFVVRRLT
jgi:ATP-dependent protease HslVU (ClpYQ) peptidase subunit